LPRVERKEKRENGEDSHSFSHSSFLFPSIEFEVQHGKGDVPPGTVNRQGAKCPFCNTPVGFPYIRSEGKAGRLGARLMAIVADGKNGRIYLSPDEEHIKAAQVDKPADYPDAAMPEKALGFRTQEYGMNKYTDLFTNRQLTALTTFSDLVQEAIKKIEEDISQRHKGRKEYDGYAQAVGTYLACILDKSLDYNNSCCSWHTSGEKIGHLFSRQAIPMVWDFTETNIFSNSTGSWNNFVEQIYKAIKFSPANKQGFALQQDASKLVLNNSFVISTDPPYYDNIDYSDLSDFFYIWLRKSLKNIYPSLFLTVLVPKNEELIANPFRFDGSKEKAKQFFEDGMLKAFQNMRKNVHPDYPLTIYYAYKQSESEEEDNEENIRDNSRNSLINSSTGWETMLQAIIDAGFSITGTWPMRTELANRTRGISSNALASSIVIVCRPREDDAPSITRKDFLGELRGSLKTGLHKLQSGNIAPVDLAQASIGPGIAVYSKYKEILEADGRPMSVRQALVMINQELDAYLSSQEGSLDSNSRFCIAWYEEYGTAAADYGRAETLAKAKLAHIQDLADEGALESGRGKVRLLKQSELSDDANFIKAKSIWALMQYLCRAVVQGGKEKAAALMADISGANPGAIENIKALAYRAYMIAGGKGWNDEALAYNSLVSLWSDLSVKMNEISRQGAKKQGELYFK